MSKDSQIQTTQEIAVHRNGNPPERSNEPEITLGDMVAVTGLIERVQKADTKEVIQEGKQIGLKYIDELEALMQIADTVAIGNSDQTQENETLGCGDIFEGVIDDEEDEVQGGRREDPFFCDRVLRIDDEHGLVKINDFLSLKRTRIHCAGAANKFYLRGGDRKDLLQEAYFGAAKAFRDFSPDKGAFWGFVDLCVMRQVITAVKTDTRNKHRVLNNAISFDHSPSLNGDDEDMPLSDAIAHPGSHEPVDILIAIESFYELIAEIDEKLTPLEEFCFLAAYCEGLPYEQIVTKLQNEKSYLLSWEHVRGGVKTVDNAIQRAKNKISVKFY